MKKKNVDALKARIDNIERLINKELKSRDISYGKLRHELLLVMTGMRYCAGIIDKDDPLHDKTDDDIAIGITVGTSILGLMCDIDDFKGRGDGDE